MLIFDLRAIGNKLLALRKKVGMTQAEVAEVAGLSDRTYADIERGCVNMRLETLLRICNVLRITPDEILTEENSKKQLQPEQLLAQLKACSPADQEKAFRLLAFYLETLK